ncbi:MAG TPA: hypothetical protein VGM39_10740 [Kofleriaceae bacterium]|jgi:hypothetical protein
MKLRDVAAGLGLNVGCGDNSCVWGSPGGMATNGGCRCNRGPEGYSDRSMMLQMQQVARHLLDVYNVLGVVKK